MKSLLVCTDGSAYAQEACRYAAWLSRRTGACLDVLYVTDLRQFEVPAVADLSGSMGVQPFEGMIAQLQEVEKIKAKFVEEQAMKVFQAAGLEHKTSFHHETGLLVDVIKDYTDQAGLILIGKRGENVNFATEHLGSMLERVVRSASKPCLVTNRKFKEIHQVAIAYDGGPSCRKALRYVCENALFNGLKIHVLSCNEGHKEATATQRLQEAEQQLNAAGIFPVCQVLTGLVEAAISDYVENTEIDLLILGAYGHSRIRELLIGSTTTELMRSCYVPLLCFR
ncbi:MAG: universal stress protein [Opitutales bacterium]